MLFNKKIERVCQYCHHTSAIHEDYVICGKKKCRKNLDDKCFHFKYDPLKRIPSKQKAQDFSKYDEYDYSL